MPTPPTRVDYQETAAWNTGGSPKAIPSMAWQTGDIIVVLCLEEANTTDMVPTVAGLTFASIQTNNAASTCYSRLYTATAASSSSGAISITGDTSNHWGAAVWIWRGSSGVGASNESHTTTRTVALVSQQADSAICWGIGDFNAGALGTLTPTPTNTGERSQDTSHYSIYAADLADQSSTASTGYGTTGVATNGPWSIVVVEIKGRTSSARLGSRLRPRPFTPGDTGRR